MVSKRCTPNQPTKQATSLAPWDIFHPSKPIGKVRFRKPRSGTGTVLGFSDFQHLGFASTVGKIKCQSSWLKHEAARFWWSEGSRLKLHNRWQVVPQHLPHLGPGADYTWPLPQRYFLNEIGTKNDSNHPLFERNFVAGNHISTWESTISGEWKTRIHLIIPLRWRSCWDKQAWSDIPLLSKKLLSCWRIS